MYKDKKILALIPARGGSKGIKDKNIINLNGQPLISYTIDSAKYSCYIDDIVVTTDSEKIANVAKAFGAEIPFMRPASLAADSSKTIDCVLHAIHMLENLHRHYDILILLQPTQPLRTAGDIDEAIETFFTSNAKNLVSVSPVTDAPVLIRQINSDGTLKHLLEQSSTIRRQDMQPYYVVNGCIYINKISDIDESTSFNDNEYSYIMSSEHSVDIDEPADLTMAAYYLTNK